VLRQPSPQARLLSLDEAAVRRAVPDVDILVDHAFLALICETEADAARAHAAAEAAARWEAAVAVVHRTGLVPIGEAAVAIVTATAHRAEAYEANRFVIEAIKQRLPIWKRERFADGSEWKRPGA
jgi:molybdopterin synthase catalytic subunit